MSKGKCFSMVNMGQRNPKDFYQTPCNMTLSLIRECLFDFSVSVHEPAAGELAIVKVLKKYFKDVTYSDKYYDKGLDFLNDNTHYHQIITNPPFSLANQFIQHAKDIGTDKFAFLLPLAYLHGKFRYDHKLYKTLKYVYVFTRMPELSLELKEDDTSYGAMQVFAWYFWVKGYKEEPVIRWIDNNDYVKGSNPKHNKKLNKETTNESNLCIR